jgi:uncharacterized protein YcnI
MKRLIVGTIVSIATITMIPLSAFAHVVVTPNQAGIGQELVFNVSVPNEREIGVTTVKLDIPKGVEEVTPTVIPGWTITTDGSDDSVTAITWTGTIPVGQREDFSFGAQVPATATQLDWKAYQTYADGTVVHWDQTPAGSDDATGNAGPYSVTKVTNDLTTSTTTTAANSNSNLPVLSIILSIFAVLVSIISLLARKRK